MSTVLETLKSTNAINRNRLSHSYASSDEENSNILLKIQAEFTNSHIIYSKATMYCDKYRRDRIFWYIQ